jgi:hypothetical protein
MNEAALRKTLMAGSLVFGSSAFLLLVIPSLFVKLLGLDQLSQNSWSMRMLGITVFALAGNMLQHSLGASASGIKRVSWLMCVSAGVLGVLTLSIPVHLTPFCILYAAVGFAFSLSYLFNLLGARK